LEQALFVSGIEIDKYATQIYQSHFPNHKNYGDITKINPKEFFQTLTFLLEDSLASLFQSLESEEDLTILEELIL
jgi:hypothetical protein